MVIRGPDGERILDMHEFHRGPYRTAVGDDEMLIEIRVPLHERSGSAYEKVDRRVGDWAVAAAGASLTLDGDGTIERAGIALAAVGADVISSEAQARARRQAAVGGAVRSRPAGWQPRRARRCTDQRGSAEYKRHVAGVLTGARCAARQRARSAEAGVMQVTVSVNDREHTRDVEPRMLLVHFLRDELRLTGTHWGCDTSNCGTCVVLMDGEPVKSCTVLAATAAGHEIRTVEGLEVDGVLDPVQQGFTEEHGLQCGFCTPGMMLTARALLDRRAGMANPDAHRRGDPGGDLGSDLPLHGLRDDRPLDPLGGRALDTRRLAVDGHVGGTNSRRCEMPVVIGASTGWGVGLVLGVVVVLVAAAIVITIVVLAATDRQAGARRPSQGVEKVREQTDALSGIARINDSGVRILHSARALQKGGGRKMTVASPHCPTTAPGGSRSASASSRRWSSRRCWSC